MRIAIVAVGKLRDGGMKDMFAGYAKRLTWPLQVVEIADRSNDPTSVRKQREGGELRQRLPEGPVIALDETGRNISSEDLAALLERLQESGAGSVSFAIGGADGHDAQTIAEADHVISFGKATWPHQLVRVMLIEQIYRASTILAGHPYHRR